jgi:hypothetical protein
VWGVGEVGTPDKEISSSVLLQGVVATGHAGQPSFFGRRRIFHLV